VGADGYQYANSPTCQASTLMFHDGASRAYCVREEAAASLTGAR
jgi:hypothetical protein